MTKNGVLTVLVALTVVMQAVILYRQPRPPKPPQVTADAPRDFHFDIADLPAKGSSSAKVVMVEFSDYECPYCAKHAMTVLPQLMKDFVDKGRLRYVFANNPLQMHPNAPLLAGIAICAGEQGRYWEAHDFLFARKQEPSAVAGIVAAETGLDGAQLQVCVESASHGQAIRRDQELARQLGLSSTPAFAVGRVLAGTRVELLKIIRGAVPMDVFADVIADVLEAVERG